MKMITTAILYFAITFISLAPVVPNRAEIMAREIHHLKRVEYREEVIRVVAQYVSIPDNVDIGHLAYMYELAIELDLPLDIIFRQVNQESRFNPHALSHKGAYGYTQLMPDTYREEYLRHGFPEEFIDIDNPYINIYIGFHYLREQWDRWGRWDYALAAYNAGPAKVSRYGGIPPYKETMNYVRVIYGI